MPQHGNYLDDIDVEPLSVYVMHEKAERKFPMHSHHKGQLTFVEGGIAYCNFPDRSLVIPARHYIWIPSQMEHYMVIRHSRSTTTRNLYFYSQDDDSHPFYNKMGIYPVNDLLLNMITYSAKWKEHVLPGDAGFRFLASLKDILPDVSTAAIPIGLPTTRHERLLPVLQYLAAHFDQNLTLESVSSHFGISERTLSRLFTNILEMSFVQYLKMLRVVKGIEMMLQTNQNLSEIAYQTGYGSIAAFSKVFYQLTNKRPSVFLQGIH
ncbi:helix-turn-helix domain-containing protein [Chitinophaga oryziterrae]|uniref:Helix-turn-helix domain-containing protein n=1 Tax=Chitinophaga oryziterrae TaxID=1031224 RepID=A0A6N8J8Z8_9BACT|nr:AraC family transcriptional regulator [Chitinophaga oryziterrae]MVT40776.1 helix-turn-helix domain-containing protein [Chitinophaga oryziterrae]